MKQEYGKELLPFIRNTISAALSQPVKEISLDHNYSEKGASFVTLTINDELRGCIGSIEAYRPLIDDIRHNSLAAAFEDPRFSPLTTPEWEKTKCELSILTPPENIIFKDKDDLFSQIVPFEDGLLIEGGFCRGTFLPQVWEHYPETEEFMFYLKLKAGLPSHYPLEKLKVRKYQVDKWKE